jgi:hypothetical protein
MAEESGGRRAPFVHSSRGLLHPDLEDTTMTLLSTSIVSMMLCGPMTPGQGTEPCAFPPDLPDRESLVRERTVPASEAAGADAGGLAGAGAPHRIVIRFLIVRRSDGSGGLDESKLDYFMRDLNYGFRDTPFVYVQLPEITYIDDDALYENLPDWPTATALLQAHAQPGVMNHIITPTIFGGPPITGLNFPFNPRGNIVAYERIGHPHSIVFPPHEVGHVFWLFHPYEMQFGDECTSGSNCAAAGDRVCDTPASPIVHGGNTTATGVFYRDIDGPCAGDRPYAPLTDLYMEAGWPAGHILRDRFTPGQVTRMLNTLNIFSPDLVGLQRPDVLADCDGDGIDDVEAILAGAAPDLNRDLVPDGCEILPRPGDLLVCGMTDDVLNRVRIFDRETGAFRETMWNGMTYVHSLRLGPDGLVYITRLGIVQRLDLATGRTRDNFLDGHFEDAVTFVDLLFDDAGDLLVLDIVSQNIRRYDGETGLFVDMFAPAVGMNSPKAMEYGPDGHIYVVGNGGAGNTIQRIDRETGATLGSWITPGLGGLIAGQGILFHTDGLVYVSNAGANNVLRYDASDASFVDVFVSSGAGGLSNPHALRFGPDGNLYVASRGDDSVKRYDGSTGAPLGDFVAPGADGLDQPTGLLFVPDAAGAPGDVDGDGVVGFPDLLAILAAWGPCLDCPEDLDGNGTVDFQDLLVVLANWT